MNSISPGGGGRISLTSRENQESYGGDECVDYRIGQSVFLGARFIFECGAKIEGTPIVIATALNMFHRFCKEVELKNYDVYLIGATCLYLAGKVENQHLRIRDVINVAYTSVHRNSMPPDIGGVYNAFKEGIFAAELLMMRILKFKVTFDHPHKYLTHYLKSIQEWVGYDLSYKTPVARTSWAILQDFHHDPSVIQYPPEALAIAAIELAHKVYGTKVPLCSDEGKNCWQMIMYPDFQQDVQLEIREKMLRVYEKETELLTNPRLEKTLNGK